MITEVMLCDNVMAIAPSRLQPEHIGTSAADQVTDLAADQDERG